MEAAPHLPVMPTREVNAGVGMVGWAAEEWAVKEECGKEREVAGRRRHQQRERGDAEERKALFVRVREGQGWERKQGGDATEKPRKCAKQSVKRAEAKRE